jgi:hypothetical protein
MGILPVINRSQVILDDDLANRSPSIDEIIEITTRALSELGIGFRGITASDREVIVKDEEPERRGGRGPGFFICPHCGFITPYEEEYWNHLKIHYIGF